MKVREVNYLHNAYVHFHFFCIFVLIKDVFDFNDTDTFFAPFGGINR